MTTRRLEVPTGYYAVRDRPSFIFYPQLGATFPLFYKTPTPHGLLLSKLQRLQKKNAAPALGNSLTYRPLQRRGIKLRFRMKRVNATHLKQRSFSSSFDTKCGISKPALIAVYCLPCLEVAASELVLVPISSVDPVKNATAYIYIQKHIYTHTYSSHV